MPLFILGTHYHNAPIAIRERVAIAGESLTQALHSLHGQPGIHEAVIISTCNRTEIYSLADNAENLKHWFAAYFGVTLEAWSMYLSEYHDEVAVKHMMHVASGLDSMVLGETQVLGQVKQAYAAALQAGTVGKHLSRLFQMAFKTAKSVRSQTVIGEQPISLPSAAIKLSQHIFQDIKQKRVLLIGAGEMIELSAKYLKTLQVAQMFFSNRTGDKATQLAMEYKGSVIHLSDVPHSLHEMDMVITATASELPLIGKGSVERAMRARKQKALVLIDLSVPRDIEPEIKSLDNVYLYDIDSLETVVSANKEARANAANQAKLLIEKQVNDYLKWQQELENIYAVKEYREHHEQLRDQALDKAKKSINAGKPAGDVLTELAHTLTNKLLHAPTISLKQVVKRDVIES